MIGEDWEVQLQTYHFSLKAFANKNVNLNLEDLKTITLLFDQTPHGVIVLDEIGVSQE